MRHSKQTVGIATHERLERRAEMLAQSEKKAWEVVEQRNAELMSLQSEVDRLARIAEHRDLFAIIAEERAEAVAAERAGMLAYLREHVPMLEHVAEVIRTGRHLDYCGARHEG